MLKRKRKQYSRKYWRRLAQSAVQDSENHLRAHANDEIPLPDNRDNCDSSFSEENDDRVFLPEIAQEEIHEVLQNEEVIPEALQEEICREEFISSDEYNSDYSLESEDENTGVNINRLRLNLVKWAHNYNICKSAVTGLLKDVLKVEDAMKFLPADARTLLKTPRKADTIPMAHGLYVHFGIQEGLDHIMQSSGTVTYIPPEIHLSFNIDGLPLTKSSKSQLWPILGSIRNFENKSPFIIGAFHGRNKPPDAEIFLKYFIEEAESLKETDYIWNGMNRKFIIDCFICDAPARAYICCIKYPGGYYACAKCETKGKYVRKVVYPEKDAPLRTAESFATQSQPEHHNGISPLLRLEIDMVSQVPYDYMHLVLLGHVKKGLKIMTGKLHPMKLGVQQVSDISQRQLDLQRYIPLEFARKPRALDELDRMKATEFRQYLFYSGLVVLRKIVRSNVYNHFIKLSVAMRLLATPGIDCEQNRYAKNLLEEYFVEYLQLYGEENATYNTHGMLHLANDALRWGSLDEFSAFTFENYLRSIKKLIKGNDKPLEQLSNRVYEMRNNYSVKLFNEDINTYRLGRECYNGNLISGCTSPMYKDIQFNNFKMTTKKPNNYCIMHDECIVIVENICHYNNSVAIIGRALKNGKPFFHSPALSTCFGIVQFSEEYDFLQAFPINNIKNKAVVLPIYDKLCNESNNHRNVVSFPLIHGNC